MIGEAAVEMGLAADHVHFAVNNEEAIAFLRRLTQAGDSILVKGSRSMQMEDIVHALASSPA